MSIEELTDVLTWQGITFGQNDEADFLLDDGIEGLAHVGVSPAWKPRHDGGAVGGTAYPGPRMVTATAVLDGGADADLDALWRLHEAMRPRPNPTDELPLSWSGLMWPGHHCVFARPTRCDWLTDQIGVDQAAPAVALQWAASDPTVYTYEQTTALLVATGSPTGSASGQAANPGIEVPWARRAWDLRWTAHGTVTSPRIRVEHPGGAWEQVTLQGLTMAGGQVLTLGEDRLFRVGTQVVNGYARFQTNATVSSRAPRWPRLLTSTGTDSANVVTMSVATGTFSGFAKVRGTR
jgi:hypothetical protein